MTEAQEPRIPGRGDDLDAAIAAPDDRTDPASLPAMQIQEQYADREPDRPADDAPASSDTGGDPRPLSATRKKRVCEG